MPWDLRRVEQSELDQQVAWQVAAVVAGAPGADSVPDARLERFTHVNRKIQGQMDVNAALMIKDVWHLARRALLVWQLEADHLRGAAQVPFPGLFLFHQPEVLVDGFRDHAAEVFLQQDTAFAIAGNDYLGNHVQFFPFFAAGHGDIGHDQVDGVVCGQVPKEGIAVAGAFLGGEHLVADFVRQDEAELGCVQEPGLHRVEPDVPETVSSRESVQVERWHQLHLQQQIAPEGVHFQHLHPQGAEALQFGLDVGVGKRHDR